MKSLLALAALSLVACWTSAAAAASTAAADHAAEMKECAVCKHMAEDADLMKSLSWEIHKIADGMICIATVPKDMKEKLDAAEKQMMATVEGLAAKFAAGDEVKLCKFCEGMGALTVAGAKQESVSTATGSICLVTSRDAAVVEKIHAQADVAAAEEAAAASAK